MSPRIALDAENEHDRLALVRTFEAAPAAWDVFLWDGTRSYDVRVSRTSEGERTVSFDPDDPQRAFDDVTRVVNESGRCITVITGARRGCGVTTLALHLSAALSPTRNLSLLDLDPSSSLRPRLDLPDDSRHWGAAEDGIRSAAIPIAAGYRVLLAPPDRRGNVASVLASAALAFDHVVVDAPESPWRAPALASCSEAVLVVPPSRQGVVHARDTLRRHPDVRWSCVVNRLGPGGELTLTRLSRELGRDVTLELPCSPYLRDREDDHRLLTAGWSRYFRRTSRLASSLS